MFDPEKIKITKLALRTITQMGTGKIVYSIVQNNVPVITTFDKVKVGVGTFMLAGAVTRPVADHSDQFVDECVEGIETAVKYFNEHQQNKS